MSTYQVTREQLTEAQWQNLCRLFELTVRLKRKVMARRAELQKEH